MRPFANCLFLAALLAGCDAATNALDPATSESSGPALAAAGTIVDPNTLIPVPPPGAVCRADGNGTICHTGLTIDLVNEPVFDLTCGTIYETSHDVRRGIRWYDTDNRLVKRFVTQDAEGTWTLSPTGDGPTATLAVHANWTNHYAIPGDEASADEADHGEGTIRAPGFGTIVHTAGLDTHNPEGGHRGVFRFVDDPAVAAELCAALTR